MNYKEFRFWLDGFLAGKEQLTKVEIEVIKKQMENLIDDPISTNPNLIPSHPIPRKDITFPHPMNPTCDTSKQLLKDGVYGPGRDNYGRDKKI